VGAPQATEDLGSYMQTAAQVLPVLVLTKAFVHPRRKPLAGDSQGTRCHYYTVYLIAHCSGLILAAIGEAVAFVAVVGKPNHREVVAVGTALSIAGLLLLEDLITPQLPHDQRKRRTLYATAIVAAILLLIGLVLFAAPRLLDHLISQAGVP
jgi:hypothetical protein